MPYPDQNLAHADTLPPAFACTTTHGGLNAAWIDVVGELDIATAPQLARTLRESQQLAHLTVLDLRELAFMDCSGVHTSSTPASGPGRPAAAWYSCAADPDSVARVTKPLLLALAPLALAAVLAAPAHATTNCAQVDVNLPHGAEGGAVRIKASNTPCSTARAIARRFITGPCRQPGWNVTNLTSTYGVRFARGGAVVTFQPVGGGRCVADDYATYRPAPTRRCSNAFSGPDQPGIKITARAISCAKARQTIRQQIRQGCPGDNYSGRGCETRYFGRCKINGDRETFELYRVTCYGDLERRIAWTGGS